MFKNEELEGFLFLFHKAENIPFTNYEDAMVNNYSVLDVPFHNYESIIYSHNFLLTEIKENILTLKLEERLLYLEYLESRIKNESRRFKIDKLIEILNSLEIDIDNLDYKENSQIEGALVKNFKSISDREILGKLSDLHREYYKYLLDIEREKVLKSINDLIVMTEKNDDFSEKLKWIGKPSQLGFIIGSLAQLGYLEVPRHKTGEINYNQFAKLVKSTFQIDTTEATLSKYLNLDSDKGQETDRKFNARGFSIPHLKEIS